MKILALTFGNETAASSLYRIYQYLIPLAKLGIEITPVPADHFDQWAAIGNYDLVLVQKKLFSTGRARFLRKHAPRLVYDTDDAIWEPHGRPHHWFTSWRTDRRLASIAGLADGCFVANEVLATRLRRHSGRVDVIPMSLDETVWRPRQRDETGRLRIGWAGAPVNLRYLTAIEASLLAVQRQHPEVEIVIYCGEPPKFNHELKVTHVPYRPGAEVATVQTFDIGLLPLPDNPFAHGKSPIKGLQYMACGAVTIASHLGATLEMFYGGETALFATSEEDWANNLLRLINEPELRKQMGQRSREHFATHHARSSVVLAFAKVLQSYKK